MNHTIIIAIILAFTSPAFAETLPSPKATVDKNATWRKQIQTYRNAGATFQHNCFPTSDPPYCHQMAVVSQEGIVYSMYEIFDMNNVLQSRLTCVGVKNMSSLRTCENHDTGAKWRQMYDDKTQSWSTVATDRKQSQPASSDDKI